MQSKILVVEDDASLREALIDTLELADYECIEADSAEAALIILSKDKVDLVISDVQMAGIGGMALLSNIKHKWPDLPILVMTAYANIEDAVVVMKSGAIDYMAKPFSPEFLINMIRRYIPVKPIRLESTIAEDPKSIELLNLAKKVAKTDATVMVLGPSGSGKEVLCRYIHENSPRCKEPFIAINCAAIPDNMMEATLFGYEKGAFTGAIQASAGKFEQAQKGTILLDEISEMGCNLQAKLLRVLQEKEVERLGGKKTIKLDIRVVATSNRNLREYVKKGHFREDLYYRLNVFPLEWLPLNQRKGDILPIAEYFLSKNSSQYTKQRLSFTKDAKNILKAYEWPGNVRELDNIIQRALILSDYSDIKPEHILLEENKSDYTIEKEDKVIE